MRDRSVVVTGAGSGIGRAVVLACARRGASVAALDIDAAQMMLVSVRAGRHPAPIPQCLIGDDAKLAARRLRDLLRADAAEAARVRAEQFANLFRVRGADGDSGQIIGPHGPKCATVPADRGANGTDDPGLSDGSRQVSGHEPIVGEPPKRPAWRWISASSP